MDFPQPDPADRTRAQAIAWISTYLGPLTVADAPLQDADLPANSANNTGSVNWYIDVGTNTLRVKVKYPDGTVKTGQVALM